MVGWQSVLGECDWLVDKDWETVRKTERLSPSPDDDSKYIATTAKDGCLLFWKWDPTTLKFHDKPVKFMEKNRVSDQTLCSAFSPGGKFYVTGGTDKIVRVYEMSDPPILVNELTGHTDRILTIQFNNNGQCCFATGSCDGTSIIWRYSSSQWSSIVLVASVDQQL
uniref:Uncharacterized protein n=1 Tax=Amphimedon queenslandica TaxID=400682 RepID=A0A1X7SVG1_AMPQE